MSHLPLSVEAEEPQVTTNKVTTSNENGGNAPPFIVNDHFYALSLD